MSNPFFNSEVPALAETVPAGRVVTLTGSLTGLAADSSESPLGISFSSGVEDDYIDVVSLGSVLCDASGSIAKGAPVAASDDGDGKVADASGAAIASGSSSAWVLGVAQTAASGGKVRVFVNPSFVPAGE